MRNALGSTLAAVALAVCSLTGYAQNYPVKPVRIIVPFPAGGNTDIVARLIAQNLSTIWGQQVIVDNRPGGATNIGTELVIRSPADGYTILMGGAANAVNMALFRKPSYELLRDLAPIVLCTTGASVLAVHPSVPVKNLRELIALARKRPGELNYASAGIGSANHMAGELFTSMAKINITHVPYKGNPPAFADTVGGHVEMVFGGVTSMVPLIDNNRLRPIAIGSKQRFPSVPNIPTFDEAGVPGYEAQTWFGLMAPAKTPPELIQKINADVSKILKSPEITKRLIADGQNPGGQPVDEFIAFIRSDLEKFARLVKEANIPQQ